MGYKLMLRDIRKAKRMTHIELAKAIGSTDRIIGSWERGETDISLEDAFKVCLVLECTPNDLCGWDGGNGGASFSDSGQASLNAYYESMNSQGRETLVQTARLMSGSPDTRIQKDKPEHVRVQEAM